MSPLTETCLKEHDTVWTEVSATMVGDGIGFPISVPTTLSRGNRAHRQERVGAYRNEWVGAQD